jgi:hypothetical protein
VEINDKLGKTTKEAPDISNIWGFLIVNPPGEGEEKEAVPGYFSTGEWG